MKKFTKFILIIFSVLALVFSCAKIDNSYYHGTTGTIVNTKGEYAILFEGSQPQITKASITNNVSGTNYDEFNLFVWNSNNDTIMKPYLVQATGAGVYKYDNIANQNLKYFSNTADSYDFIGIIPTTHTMSIKDGVVGIKDLVSFVADDNRVTGTLSADSDEEFLYTYKNVVKGNYKSTVELPFEHENALIYIGFSSDRDDTEIIDYVPGTPDIPAVPDHNDTTGVHFNVKNAASTLVGSVTDRSGTNIIPQALIDEIKSYYSLDGQDAGDYSGKVTQYGGINTSAHTLKVVKAIPANYKLTVECGGVASFDFFDGFKYLADNGVTLNVGNGGKPAAWDNVLINVYVNGNGYYSVDTFNPFISSGSTNSKPVYEITNIPGTTAVPGRTAIEGIRVFSANSLGDNVYDALGNVTDTLHCVHIPHTTVADATVSSAGCILSNRTTSDSVIQFSLPATTTLNITPVWSPSTFYSLPGDTDFNYIVVKVSYIYNGVTTYDVRVPIQLPAGGLQPGKYYKYEIYITSTYNGTNDPDEAADEKDEILIEGLNPIVVTLVDQGYTLGADQKITI